MPRDGSVHRKLRHVQMLTFAGCCSTATAKLFTARNFQLIILHLVRDGSLSKLSVAEMAWDESTAEVTCPYHQAFSTTMPSIHRAKDGTEKMHFQQLCKKRERSVQLSTFD